MVDDCYHSCKFISRPSIGIGVQGNLLSCYTMCAWGHLSPHDTETEALNNCGDQSQRDDFGFSRSCVAKRQTNPRDAIIKKIFRSRLAGRHDTWRNQQWERVLQRKIYLVGRIEVKSRSKSGVWNICSYESLRPIDSSSQSGNFLSRLNTTHSINLYQRRELCGQLERA